MLKTHNAIKISDNDNVAVALGKINANDDVFDIKAESPIPAGHKIALSNIKKGQNIIKYGYPIGHATTDINIGSHVHVHNIKTNLKDTLEYEYTPFLKEESERFLPECTFEGYVRKDGKVGIRNEIWIINTVGCVNKVAEEIVKEANIKFAGKTDGIFTFTHPFGCSQLGDDHLYTQKILANMVTHPNAGGVLVLGLGCENNTTESFKSIIGDYDEDRVKFLICQDVEDEVSEALDILEELVELVSGFKRQPVDISKLTIGLKCGGSDGLSGITGNPLLGCISDRLASYGGITILSEVPEMFGAETILMNRCETKELFDQTVSLINDFKNYFIKYGQEIYENPSPGNKDGGISTLEDKSLGCTQKGGSSNVKAVVNYGERVKVKGLNLLESPGNDIVAITALMAAGAQIILFTTGRGTPIGGAVPTVKVSTNTNLSVKKKSWIDFNSGTLVEGTSMEQLTDDFWQYIIDLASGKIRTKNEINNYREISIFRDGVTL